MFSYLTCDGVMNAGVRRLLILLSLPFFVFFIIPGLLFWVLVHAGLWVLDGYLVENKWAVNEDNNMFYWMVSMVNNKPVKYMSSIGVCSRCGKEVGMLNLDNSGLCESCFKNHHD
jgi:hypothetical protein